MSSDRPTDPDLLKPSELPSSTTGAPFGLEGDADSLVETNPPAGESAVVFREEPDPPIPENPTMKDLFEEQRRIAQKQRALIVHLIGGVREELRQATANIGDEYGERLRVLEDDLNNRRLASANGSTRHTF